MLPLEQSTSQIAPHEVPRAAWILMCVLVVVATLLHFLIGQNWVVESIISGNVSGDRLNTRVFASVGLAFISLALFSHFVVKQVMRYFVAPSNARDKTIGPERISSLLVPMAIRFAGTFALLGSLIFFEAVSRNEAVFDVLFWYTTLTTIETVGIVYASRSAMHRHRSPVVLHAIDSDTMSS